VRDVKGIVNSSSSCRGHSWCRHKKCTATPVTYHSPRITEKLNYRLTEYLHLSHVPMIQSERIQYLLRVLSSDFEKIARKHWTIAHATKNTSLWTLGTFTSATHSFITKRKLKIFGKKGSFLNIVFFFTTLTLRR
jgi:hypothetical protein